MTVLGVGAACCETPGECDIKCDFKGKQKARKSTTGKAHQGKAKTEAEADEK